MSDLFVHISGDKDRITGPRVRKLLEPFRRLHSINDLRIVGPFSDKYKTEMLADVSKPPPRDQEPFARVLATYEKAISRFDSGDFVSSIRELGNTLNELDDAVRLHKGDFDLQIVLGPYATFTLREASENTELKSLDEVSLGLFKGMLLECMEGCRIDFLWSHTYVGYLYL